MDKGTGQTKKKLRAMDLILQSRLLCHDILVDAENGVYKEDTLTSQKSQPV